MNLEFVRHIFKKSSIIKFNENPSRAGGGGGGFSFNGEEGGGAALGRPKRLF